MTADLPARILAAIEADEATARAATADGGSWSSRSPHNSALHVFGEYGWIVSGPDVETEDSEWGKGVADHIARHDPARVLARCAADRDIVALHTATAEDECPGCGAWLDGTWKTGPGETCPTLRALAAGYGIESEEA